MSNDSFKYTPDADRPTPSAEDGPPAKSVADKLKKKESTPDAAKKPELPWSPAASVIYTLVVYFFGQLIASMVIIVAAHLTGGSRADQDKWLDTSIAAQFYFVLLTEGITFWAVWWFIRARGATLRIVGWRAPRWRELLYVVIGFGVYFLIFAMALAIATHLFPSINLDQKQELGFENPATPSALVITFISLVILPPIVEETVFRGFLYTGLRSKMKPILAGLITSLLFASAHLQIGSGKPLLWVAAIDTFTLSLVLCYLRQKTDSLWPGIMLHALKNGIAFFSLFVIAAH